MISSRLFGGLGNQMFQISAAYSLAVKNNDTSGFNFNECYTPLQGRPSKFYVGNIFKNVSAIDHYDFKNYYTESSHEYSPIPYSNDLLLDGYFQSEKYFNNIKDEIINLFYMDTYSNEINEFLKYDKPVTSVHIRRGDYLKNPNIHPTCDLNYYKNAIEMIGDSYFLFLSDDIEWVKQNFKGENYIFSDFNNDILELELMSKCQNNIIANSTFSWWGAYLNKNVNKKIIAPLIWFGEKGPKNYSDVVPESWIKI